MHQQVVDPEAQPSNTPFINRIQQVGPLCVCVCVCVCVCAPTMYNPSNAPFTNCCIPQAGIFTCNPAFAGSEMQAMY